MLSSILRCPTPSRWTRGGLGMVTSFLTFQLPRNVLVTTLHMNISFGLEEKD